jgi:hypothetical protein
MMAVGRHLLRLFLDPSRTSACTHIRASISVLDYGQGINPLITDIKVDSR